LVAGVKALTCDVFGTVVDWRGGIVRAGNSLRQGALSSIDWERLADAWRQRYQPAMARVTRGELPWLPFDALQRLMLDEALAEQGATELTESEKAELTDVWAQLDPWPDSVSGLTRLRRQLIVCTLSNGSVRQLVGLSKRAAIPWDLILSVEMFRTYKPDPRVYRGAVEFLQCPPEEVMMVAAHVYDLRAARDHGFRTAFVARPLEWGPHGEAERPEPGEFDVLATDLEDLANQLQA